jgi:hypothetical protein
VNNSGSGANVNLPTGSAAGTFIRIMGTSTVVSPNLFTVNTQGTDRIFICENGCGTTTTTFRQAGRMLAFQSDGTGHWYAVGSL